MMQKPTGNTSETNRELAHQNFGLRKAAFHEMLQQMKAGDEGLFEKIFLSQFEETITYVMQQYQVNRAMAYDATMEALLKFRKRLLEGKIVYKNMRFLFTQMAGQFLVTALKKEGKSVAFDLHEDVEEVEEKIDDIILDILDAAWKQLGDECSKLLENFYYKKVALKELAQKLGKTDAALRKQKQRCLEALRSYFLKRYKR